MHDPIHNGLDALLRKAAGEKDVLSQYWAELRGKTEPGSYSTMGSRTAGMDRRRGSGIQTYGPFPDPFQPIFDPMGRAQVNSPPSVPGIRSASGPGFYRDDPIFGGRRPAGYRPDAPTFPPFRDPIRPAGQCQEEVPIAKSIPHSNGPLGRSSEHGHDTSAGQTNPDKAIPQPLSRQKETERSRTKRETSIPQQSGFKPPSQASQAGTSKTQRTRRPLDDEVSLAETGRGIGNMGRTLVEGMVSEVDLKDSDAATIRGFGDMGRTIVQGMVPKDNQNGSRRKTKH